MKYACFLALVLFASGAQALTLKVVGVNAQTIYQIQADAAPGDSVGTFSDRVLSGALKAGQLSDYQGANYGVTSIDHMGGAMEVLSNTQMRAYGWCYDVDGKFTKSMPDQYKLSGAEQVVRWYYSFAFYDRGQWTTMCTPADHVPSKEDRN